MPTNTSNVVTSKSGTGFTVDVTVANLDPDINVRDFFILHNGTPYTTLSDYTKTSSTTLTYTGSSLGTTTVEVRRKTPYDVIRAVNFGERMSSALWNNELERKSRWQAEADLNGVGAAFSGTIPTPKNDVFGAVWNGDTVFPPSRDAVYDYLITLATLDAPTFTGLAKSPTPTTSDSSTRIANCTYVKNNLANYATLSSPALSGIPTAPTAATTDNSVTIASTAYVKNNLASYALLASAALTGTPTAPTAATATNTTQLATTAFVKGNVNVGTNTIVLGGTLRVSWGSNVVTTNSSGDATVSYPVAFSATPQSVLGVSGDAGVGQDLIVGIISTASNASSFTFRVQKGNNTGYTSASFRINWVAIGAA